MQPSTPPTGDEVTGDDERFLAAGRLTFIFALRQDGTPSGWPMTSEYLDGALTMSTYAKAPKVGVVTRAGHLTAVAVGRSDGRITDAVCLQAAVDVRPAAAGGPTARSANSAPGAAALQVPQPILAGVERAEGEGKRVVIVATRETMRVSFRVGRDGQA